jgi:putative lipoprotein
VSVLVGSATRALALAVLAVARPGAVTGTVTWQARDPLPPGSFIELQLSDVGPADTAARPVGEVRIPAGGLRSPVPFELPYDPQSIDERREYAVRARITDGEKRLLYVSERRHLVLTRGARMDVEVQVEPVRAGRSR